MTFGENVPIEFWLHGVDYNKSTSLSPCPSWLLRNGFAEDKAVFSIGKEETQIELLDACLGFWLLVIG